MSVGWDVSWGVAGDVEEVAPEEEEEDADGPEGAARAKARPAFSAAEILGELLCFSCS